MGKDVCIGAPLSLNSNGAVPDGSSHTCDLPTPLNPRFLRPRLVEMQKKTRAFEGIPTTPPAP